MPMEIKDADFATKVIEKSKTKPILVDFWAAWCGPCQMLGPVIDELAVDYAGRAKVGKVDVDNEKELAKRFRVMSIPTVILFDNGEEVNRFIGVKEKEEYAAALESM